MTTEWTPLEYASEELQHLSRLAWDKNMPLTVFTVTRAHIRNITLTNGRAYGIKWTSQEAQSV